MLHLSNISFTYEGASQPSIHHINWEVKKGECWYIYGPSGSGKTTLLHTILGYCGHIIDGKLTGEYTLDGKAVCVFQNPRSQFFTNEVKAELVFGLENLGLSKVQIDDRLAELMQDFPIHSLLPKPLYALSSGQRQLVALASISALKPNIYVLDEPSANLDYETAMRLRAHLLFLKAKGATILICDHRTFYLEGLVDKALYVEKGQAFERDFIYQQRPVFNPSVQLRHEVSIRLNQVSIPNRLNQVSATFDEHQIHVITGPNGAGKSSLASVIAGRLKVSKTKRWTKGEVLYLMQDKEFQLFSYDTLHELCLQQASPQQARQALAEVGLSGLERRHPLTLSGGQMQRLQVAIALVSSAPIIILDEPTSGLDEASMRLVAACLERLKKDKTIIVITHDASFIHLAADQIWMMKEGRLLSQGEENENT